MRPVLKAPGSTLLKLRYDGPLPNFAFKFNLRRYTLVNAAGTTKLTVALDFNFSYPTSRVTAPVWRRSLTLSTHVQSAWN